MLHAMRKLRDSPNERERYDDMSTARTTHVGKHEMMMGDVCGQNEIATTTLKI